MDGKRAPWHLWVVGVAALLWNASGAFTIFLAQAGRLAGISADEAAYYAAQPLWFIVITDVALLAATAGAIALLLRSRMAVWLFAASLAAIAVTHAFDLYMGTSRALANSGAMIVTVIIAVIAVLELLYARTLRSRGILRGLSALREA